MQANLQWQEILPSPQERRILLDGIICTRVVPRTPPRRKVDAADCSVEAGFGAPDRLAGLGIHMVYVDARGARTERSVTVRNIRQSANGTSLMAWCHARQSLRQFLTHRIVECYDIQTGEFYEPQPFFAELMRRKYAVRLPDLEDFVRVLAFFMHCDGEAAPEEYAALDAAIGRFLIRANGTNEDATEAMAFARRATPEGIDFLGALRRIIRSDRSAGMCRLLFHEIEEMIAADFIVHPEEEHWQRQVLLTLEKVSKA